MDRTIKALYLHPFEEGAEPEEARRCGVFPDLFATKSGEIYELKRVSTHMHNGSLVFRYEKANLAAIHAIGDAWLPDWDSEGTQLVPINGNRRDLRVENLAVAGDARRGRPRSNKVWKRMRARQLYQFCSDIEAIAEELEMTKRDVRLAVLGPEGEAKEP